MTIPTWKGRCMVSDVQCNSPTINQRHLTWKYHHERELGPLLRVILRLEANLHDHKQRNEKCCETSAKLQPRVVLGTARNHKSIFHFRIGKAERDERDPNVFFLAHRLAHLVALCAEEVHFQVLHARPHDMQLGFPRRARESGAMGSIAVAVIAADRNIHATWVFWKRHRLGDYFGHPCWSLRHPRMARTKNWEWNHRYYCELQRMLSPFELLPFR